MSGVHGLWLFVPSGWLLNITPYVISRSTAASGVFWNGVGIRPAFARK